MARERLRVVHLASLARSGETLVQRTLSAHPAVAVVHDLHPTNSAAETRLFQLLRVWPQTTIDRAAVDAVAGAGIVPGSADILLVKQGVFSMRGAFAGFGLVRNPYATFCSLWSYDAKLAGDKPTDARNRANWQRLRLPRLAAWVDATVPALLPELLATPDPVRQFLRYWELRVGQIQRQCRTVVLYEDFVRDPQPTLAAVCAAIDLPFDAALLHAERRYRPGQRGHGGIDLGQPIRPAPAWQLDPLVALEPFVRAVAAGPVAAYRTLYRRETATS